MVELFDSLSGRTRFAHFCAVFYSQPDADSYVMSGTFVRPIVLGKIVQLRVASLNRFREIPPEATEGGIFDTFVTITSLQTFRLKH